MAKARIKYRAFIFSAGNGDQLFAVIVVYAVYILNAGPFGLVTCPAFRQSHRAGSIASFEYILVLPVQCSDKALNPYFL
jgi:hypothetical protein